MLELFETLQQRRRPEDVAEMIREHLASLYSRQELAVLERAARHSLKRGLQRSTSMLEVFAAPLIPERQVHKALELFQVVQTWSAAECADPNRIELLIAELSLLIRKPVGANNFRADRLNGEQREAQGLDLSRRQYNKRFRMLTRLEAKLARYVRELRKYEFARIGKLRLATRLSWQDFSRDAPSAAFVAYFTARCGMRSVFTNTQQERPFDEIADMLLRRATQDVRSANWWAIAHVYPVPEVLAHLTDTQRGQLLGTWLVILRDIAELLREVWETSQINRETMIVRRGNDSTTWNNIASAWNRAREAWIALLHSLGMQRELDGLCLGKVLRLMAADVAAWHRISGGKLSPDTQVWNELPLPWEVLAGEQACSRAMVEAICQKHGVDPVKQGWVAPPPKRHVETYRVTPELVHGVAVADPRLATALRKAGWFSGQQAKDMEAGDEVTVVRDPHGFALEARHKAQE